MDVTKKVLAVCRYSNDEISKPLIYGTEVFMLTVLPFVGLVLSLAVSTLVW